MEMPVDDSSSFVGGFVASVLGNAPWLIQLQMPYSTAMEWLLKVFSTLILGVLGGLAGMIGKDIYKKMKQKLNR